MHKRVLHSKLLSTVVCGAVFSVAACTRETPTSKTATLSWSAPAVNSDGSPIRAITGYRIYVGTNPNQLYLRGGIVGAATTSYVVTGLAPGTYYFAVSAVADSGVESERSAVIQRTF